MTKYSSFIEKKKGENRKHLNWGFGVIRSLKWNNGSRATTLYKIKPIEYHQNAEKYGEFF